MFVSQNLHPESKNMVALIGVPGLLETRTCHEIEKIFEKDGYQKIPGARLTLGWGALVEYPETSTLTVIHTKDNRIVQVGVSPSGEYCLDVMVNDTENMTSGDRKNILQHLEFQKFLQETGNHPVPFCSEGPRFIVFAEQVQKGLR